MAKGKLKLEEEEEEEYKCTFGIFPKISHEFNYHKLSGCPKFLKFLL